MEVKPGYKMTEMGVIPEDWEVTRLGEASDVLTGFPFPSHEFSSLGVRLLRGSNVKRNAIDWDEAITKNWPAISSDLNKYELREGDIVIAMDGALVGRSFATVSKEDLPALLVQRVARLRSRKTEQNLIGSWINSDHFIRHVDLVKTHTAIPHISPKDIREFTLAVPSEGTEQRAIATALSDMDALLDGLDRLIAKKRAIKQAAMQQLLTGQTRLPGFSGEWEVKRLGEFVLIRNQKVLPTNVAPETLCVELEHIGQSDGRLLNKGEARNSSAAKYRFQVDDVLFGRLRSYLRKYWLATEDGICTTEIWPLMFDLERINSGFLFALVQTDSFIEAASISYGTHMPRADWSVVRNHEIHLPSKEEQAAIATVLSDMDAEITALETRRTKTRALKQAMMQELLTGRTRLV